MFNPWSLKLITLLPLAALIPLTAKPSEFRESQPTCGLPIFTARQIIKDRAYWYKNTRWKTGQVIPVYFLNGKKEQRKGVEHCAREWEKYGNFRFKFHTQPKTRKDHAILISFQKLRPGVAGWSSVGGGTTGTSHPSMAFLPHERGSAGCGTVLHEFGHALGLLHEQNSPGGKLDWIRAEAYKYFRKKYKWGRKQVDEKIFNKTSDKYYNWGKFDRLSVMAYYIAGKLFRDGWPLGGRSGLSLGDQKGIARLYPGKTQPTDRKPVFIYYNEQKKSLRLSVKNGRYKTYLNDQLIATIDSSKQGYKGKASEKISLEGRLRRRGKNKIHFEFSPLAQDWHYSYSFYEGKRYLDSGYCAPKRNCVRPEARWNDGFYFTHISNGNGSRTDPEPNPEQPKFNPALNLPFLDAIFEGDSARTGKLLNRGADPNAKSRGWSGLMYAAYFGHEKIAQLLLQRRVDTYVKVSGWDARRLAEQRGHSRIVRMIDAFHGQRAEAPRIKKRGRIRPPRPH